VGYSCTAFQRNTIRTLGQSVLVVAIFGWHHDPKIWWYFLRYELFAYTFNMPFIFFLLADSALCSFYSRQ
jgi:hypothetical protein